MSKSNKKTIWICIIACILIAVIPFAYGSSHGATFGGSDDAGGELVKKNDSNYKVWAEPVLEKAIGGELPGEIESRLFCVQTGIGVGILFFFLGRFVERKKLGKEDQEL